MLLRLLSVPVLAPTAEPVGKLDKLPRPGLRLDRAPEERDIELRFSNSADVAAGVGVGVGEPSDAVSGRGTGGGLGELEWVLALAAAEAGDSVYVPLVTLLTVSATWVFTVGASSDPAWGGLLAGTSRLVPRVDLRSEGLLTLIGNRPISEAPLERSRRCRWRLAGLVARLRLTMARWRASIAARRLLSSVLMARGRLELELVIPSALDWRLSSPKIESL